MMLNLTGYRETELLYDGPRTLVYRAIRQSDEQAVILKVLRNPHPSFNALVQFRNQYVITRNLKQPHVVHPLALERYGNSYALVMPDKGAISLDTYWQNSEHNLGELLKIAIQLAGALHTLAQQQIIHKDIKPANILIHPKTKHVQLIDFSIASLLPREQHQRVNPKGLEGTLAYISPEQTGRMNRGIDYRSDFYALGVTLYELLVGIVPFTKADPLDLIHAHIAQTPIPPDELLNAQGKCHPRTLSGIIMKLMAKNAEDRYQSALGLKHDLERCLRSLEASGIITKFELGQQDVCDRFLIPEKLYGREAEVQTLLNAFERVAQGQSEMLLVAGFSGIGKTAVVNEVHKPIVRQKGYFIKGKFDQFNRNIPFSALVQAFRELMGQLLSEADETLTTWKAQILAAVGENGQVLVEVIPELGQVIGQQPAVRALSGTAAQNRFNLLFEKFIGVFTSSEHPLVIFLDDLQWADSASLGLLKVLMGEGKAPYLLLLGAYRDNEVFPAHPLMLTLGELEQQVTTIATITLEPLASEQVNQLVAETLSCSAAIAQPLTELIYQKTKGNPFFTRQFLKGLYDDQFITYNAAVGYWSCDLSQVKDQALTDDVVVFMTQRLQKLSPETQTILKRAACIGNQFDLNTIAIICELAADQVAATLWDALKEGIILPQNEAYKFFQGMQSEQELVGSITVGYRFLHDRIQQAAYRLIPEQQKQIAHLKIGQLLLSNTPPEQQEAALFNIVGQLNLGAELIESLMEREHLAQLNWQAAQKAQLATAYNAAFAYCLQGYQLLGSEAAWQRNYPLTLNLATAATENAYLQSDFDVMDDWLDMTLEHAVDLLDKVKLYEIKILSYMSKNQPLKSVQAALEILSPLGVEFPENPGPDDIETAFHQTAEKFQKYTFDKLLNLPQATDQSKISALRILALVVPPTTIAVPALLPLNITQQVQLCLAYGNSDFSAFSYGNYGFLISGVLGDVVQGYKFGQLSLQYQQKYPNPIIKAKVLMTFHTFVSFWHEHFRKSLTPLKTAYHAGLDVGDLEFACYAAITYCVNSL
ncbi:MAG: serine/threonine-protein kinase PknK, partial [Spirulina sp. SIO3F2]|nr:serine/threonine-protein kinase PknK [Spirulina sp. SIO3F2]